MNKILAVGDDFELLDTRAAVLRLTGAEVEIASGREAPEHIEAKTFDVVVLCHSLSDVDVARIVEQVRRTRPGTRILMTAKYAGEEEWPRGFTDVVTCGAPKLLLEKARELLDRHRESVPATGLPIGPGGRNGNCEGV